MPAAVRAQRDQLLQKRPPVVETGDAAHRKQLSFPGFRQGPLALRAVGAAPNDRGVQNKVNGVHDLCKHSLGARRLRVAKREPDQSRQGLA